MRTYSAPMASVRPVRLLLIALTALLFAAASNILTAPSAAAHAEWLGSSPEDGATVEVLPESLTLTFSSDLLNAEGATEVVVTDESGASVTVGSPVVDGPIVTQQLAAEASAGLYRVVWKVVYADGHPGAQEFTFTVSTGTNAGTPATETSVPTPTPTASAAAVPDATTPTAAPLAPVPGDTGNTVMWILLVVVALSLIAVVAIVTIRKRRSATATDSTPDSAR